MHLFISDRHSRMRTVHQGAAAGRMGTVHQGAAAGRMGTVHQGAAAGRMRTFHQGAAAGRMGTVLQGAAASRMGNCIQSPPAGACIIKLYTISVYTVWKRCGIDPISPIRTQNAGFQGAISTEKLD